MGLWLKKDGKMVEVSGGGGGGSFDGEHVPTGDPTDPASLDLVDEGQLLWDGVEGSSGGGGDSVGGSIQYHSIGTSGVTGIEATEVDLPIVDVYGGPLVVGQEYVVSAEGSFRFGVGATSFVRQTVNINGSRAIECMAYRTFIDNERFMVSASISWDCDDANPTVTVVASCSVGSMQTYNTDERRANVTFTPMQSSGGGGDAGPHDHDYLPLTGGTLTGGLTVNGNSDLKINPFADAWGVASGTVFAPQGLVGGTQGSWATAMTSNGYRNTGGKWTSLGLQSLSGATSIELHPTGTFYVRAASDHPTGSVHSPPIRFSVTEASTTVSNTFNPAGGTAFGITEGIDTRDVLERAETATMPALDDEGVATADVDVDGLTVNEVMTAMLAKIKELSARIEELEGT